MTLRKLPLALIALSSFTTTSALAADAKTAAGTEFQDCAVCPVMVVVPAGSFLMGSPGTDANREAYEGPQHKVTLAKPFAVGKFEVTWRQFKAFVDETGYDAGNYGENAKIGTEPAVNISAVDAGAYAEWLSYKTSQEYRLLTEAEWEYAARAGTTTPYPFPSFAINKHANIEGTADGFEYQAPVGSFPSNKFGLHDMNGNVWEWIQDCWNDTYANAPADGSAWLTGNCNRRVRRGGSWSKIPAYARSAGRDWATPAARSYVNGLRVARTL